MHFGVRVRIVEAVDVRDDRGPALRRVLAARGSVTLVVHDPANARCLLAHQCLPLPSYFSHAFAKCVPGSDAGRSPTSRRAYGCATWSWNDHTSPRPKERREGKE